MKFRRRPLPTPFRIAAASLLALLLASPTCFAEWKFIRIQSDPASELCTATTQAVKDLRKDVHGRLYGTFRALETRTKSDLRSASLTFYAQLTRNYTTVDAGKVRRTFDLDYYALDIDNDGSKETVMLSSGGHGAAGEGDTLSILKRELSSTPEPVAHQELMEVVLEVGTGVTFYGAPKKFDPAYFIYPFLFKGRNYLLLEGNDMDDLKYLVVEVMPEAQLATRCYF